MEQIKDIREALIHLRNFNRNLYSYFYNDFILNSNISKGSEILENYIDKFNYVIEGSYRWVEKFI
jgi:hypothetical protein